MKRWKKQWDKVNYELQGNDILKVKYLPWQKILAEIVYCEQHLIKQLSLLLLIHLSEMKRHWDNIELKKLPEMNRDWDNMTNFGGEQVLTS